MSNLNRNHLTAEDHVRNTLYYAVGELEGRDASVIASPFGHTIQLNTGLLTLNIKADAARLLIQHMTAALAAIDADLAQMEGGVA